MILSLVRVRNYFSNDFKTVWTLVLGQLKKHCSVWKLINSQLKKMCSLRPVVCSFRNFQRLSRTNYSEGLIIPDRMWSLKSVACSLRNSQQTSLDVHYFSSSFSSSRAPTLWYNGTWGVSRGAHHYSQWAHFLFWKKEDFSSEHTNKPNSTLT